MSHHAIVVAGSSRIKLEATFIAAEYVEPWHFSVCSDPNSSSGAPEQPHGDAEILYGALNRLRTIDQCHLDAFVVAIENGVAMREQHWEDLAYVVVRSPDDVLTIRHTRGVVVPTELVVASAKTNWSVTCGKLEAERTPGTNHQNPHIVWSRGRHSRFDLLTETLKDAICQSYNQYLDRTQS